MTLDIAKLRPSREQGADKAARFVVHPRLLPEPLAKTVVSGIVQPIIESLFRVVLPREMRAISEMIIAYREGDDALLRALVEEHVGRRPDAFFIVALKGNFTHADKMLIDDFLSLLARHRERLKHRGGLARSRRRAQDRLRTEEIQEIRSGVKKFPSVDLALKALAAEGQSRDEVLEDMIPGVAYVELTELPPGGNLAGRVASQIRREGIERPDEPGMVYSPGPERLLGHADELELAAFAIRELLARMAEDAGVSEQEWESFVLGTVFDNQIAARIAWRPTNQITQEKFRASNKLRPPA